MELVHMLKSEYRIKTEERNKKMTDSRRSDKRYEGQTSDRRNMRY